MRNTAKGTSTRTNKKTKPVKRNTSIPLSLVLQNLSSNIEYLLKINNMDKSEFASYLGMTHQTLSKYLVAKDDFSERLPAPMPLRKLIAAAEILGVTPDALIYHDLEKKIGHPMRKILHPCFKGLPRFQNVHFEGTITASGICTITQ